MISVEGQWSEWKNFTECSVSCGGGIQTTYRACEATDPSNLGRLLTCEADSDGVGDEKSITCNSNICPGKSFSTFNNCYD